MEVVKRGERKIRILFTFWSNKAFLLNFKDGKFLSWHILRSAKSFPHFFLSRTKPNKNSNFCFYKQLSIDFLPIFFTRFLAFTSQMFCCIIKISSSLYYFIHLVFMRIFFRFFFKFKPQEAKRIFAGRQIKFKCLLMCRLFTETNIFFFLRLAR